MSHSSMLKARRKRQKTRKLLEGTEKRAKRIAKQAVAGPVVKKEKRPRIKKEKVQNEEKVKKVKPTQEELGRQAAKNKAPSTAKKGTWPRTHA